MICCFVADEDLCGRNVLLLTSLLREVLKIPRETVCYHSMSLYHITICITVGEVCSGVSRKSCLCGLVLGSVSVFIDLYPQAQMNEQRCLYSPACVAKSFIVMPVKALKH